MKRPIYLDYNATTPVDPRVMEAMLPYFTEDFGNANSVNHTYGWVAEAAVSKAREQVAELIQSEPNEMVFTSGATESINLAIKGVAEAYAKKGKHIVLLESEHKAVLNCCTELQKKDFEISIASVDREGIVDPIKLNHLIRNDTILVCAMLANNETGVIQNIGKISELVHAKNSLLLSDATQAIGKIRLDVKELGIDLMPLSAHKFYGPKGVGALYISRKNPRVSLVAQQHGGGHENNLRSGTLNVPGIVGLGAACEVAENDLWEDSIRISRLRTKLEQSLIDLGSIFVNGSQKHRLPNVTNLCFKGRKADDLIKRLPNLAFSSGSACSSALPEPSHVLKAMGLSDEDSYASVRFSLGKYSTEDDIETSIKQIEQVLFKN